MLLSDLDKPAVEVAQLARRDLMSRPEVPRPPPVRTRRVPARLRSDGHEHRRKTFCRFVSVTTCSGQAFEALHGPPAEAVPPWTW